VTAAVRVFGIGSPFGDDRIGWLAADALESVFDPAYVVISKHDRPGAQLIALMSGAERVVLIDGVCTGAAPGTLHRLESEAIFSVIARHTSSHGIGLAEAIKLGKILGDLPPWLVLWGIEIGGMKGEAISQAARDALPRLVSAVADEIATIIDGLEKIFTAPET